MAKSRKGVRPTVKISKIKNELVIIKPKSYLQFEGEIVAPTRARAGGLESDAVWLGVGPGNTTVDGACTLLMDAYVVLAASSASAWALLSDLQRQA